MKAQRIPPVSDVEILVVEDSPMQANILKQMLAKKGYTITHAKDGVEGLAMARRRRPTLIISDILMPVIDGYKMCQMVRQDEALAGVPVILLTSLSEPENIIRGLECGADNFIIKPYGEEYILTRVENLLKNLALREKNKGESRVQIYFAGKSWFIDTDQCQIIEMLLATFENAAKQNRELIQAQHALKSLNEQLEERVRERTERLEASEAKYRALLENNADAVLVIDRLTIVRFLNPAAERLFGRSAKELLGAPFPLPVILDTATEHEVGRPDGSTAAAEMRVVPTEWEGEEAALASLRDVTERKRLLARLDYVARHDTLTGLPNRVLFKDRLGQVMALARRKKLQSALLFMNIDRFKRIIDSLGHAMGDRVLQAIATRLKACLRETDTISRVGNEELTGTLARLGGDEFAMLVPEITQVEDVAKVARRIIDAFSQPLTLSGQEVFVTGSMGISLYPSDGDSEEALLKNAAAALSRAKEEGGGNFQFYSPAMNARVLERLTLETNLRRAIDREEFVLHYQPQVDLQTGEVFGFEALVRWQHPEMGLVSPAQFIPLAEETGLIVPIGEWVLQNACRQMKQWQEAGRPSLRIAVNLSSRQFKQENFLERVTRILNESGLNPHLLDLELTESLFMEGTPTTMNAMQELSRWGVQFSIDDFGTGYSALSYIKRFPISKLKIDRSFVNAMLSDPNDAEIVRMIVGLAHHLRLKAIAEGIETAEQLAFLQTIHCDEMQGYLFSRPLPAEQAIRIVIDGKRL
jgi:predicted signal transduction protein with EAL and GGDEF domain/DNA-binding response OmpR family regulator